MISNQFLENLSADLKHMAEDINACLRMPTDMRGEGLRQIKWWMEYNLPIFEKILEANDAAYGKKNGEIRESEVNDDCRI